MRAGPQVGPGRFQAGREPEEAGLRAGPDRGTGRGVARNGRPCGWPRLGARPDHSPKQPASWPVRPGARPGARAVTPAADGDQTAAGEGKGGARKKTKRGRDSP